jgi:hypothetical protein
LDGKTAADLRDLPHLRQCWVALDIAPHATPPRSGAEPSVWALGRWAAPKPTPKPTNGLLLKSGAMVVDADPNLDELCARLRAANRSSLTIVFAA